MDKKTSTGAEIAFQGALGANSHMACRALYPELTPLPCETFEDAFEALSSRKAKLAMIPIENNHAGRVADIHTLLPASKVFIIREHYQRIQHNLLALPGNNLEDITEVRSHVMALAQCRNRLKQWGLRHIVSADTAGAARDLAQTRPSNVGVIASALAAEIYGLEVLQANIEDSQHNTTRFVVLSTEDDWPAVDQSCMTTIIFRLKSIPAALYKCLGGFATNGVNMTKLESHVSGLNFSLAQFYMDLEGHPSDEDVARALGELKHFADGIRILGVYPKGEFRCGEVAQET